MEENLSVETLEVAAPVEEDVAQTSEQTQEVAEPETQTEVEQPKVERDYERDAAFAKLRREKEEAQKQLAEMQKQFDSATSDRNRLVSTFEMFGLKGDVDGIEDQAKAHYYNKSIDEVRNERLQIQKEMEERRQREQDALAKDNQIKDLQEQLNARILADELRAVQSIDPSIKSLDDLGSSFAKMRISGVPLEDAYYAVKRAQEASKKIAPPEMGKVNATQKADKTYYTSDEVDAMVAANDKALDDPKILALIRKSMTKW